jgi:hypothetical protein
MLSYILFASPILLIIAMGALVRVRGNRETVERRYFLFLIWTTITSLALVLLNWILPRSVFGYMTVLFPIIPGLTVLTLLYWREWDSLSNRAKIPILFTLIILVIATILRLVIVSPKGDERQLEAILFGMSLLAITVFLFIAWTWGNRHALLLGSIPLLYLTLFNATEMGSLSLPYESVHRWLTALGALAYMAIPGSTIPVMAILTTRALNVSFATRESKPVVWRQIIGRLVFVLILYGCLLYSYFWLWLWDGTDDGVRGLFMIVATVIAAVSAGLVMLMTISGWRRWMGLVFPILVTIPLYLTVITGMGLQGNVSNYTITEERAVRIQQAIQNHHAKTGWYPLDLEELVPGEMLRIPLPMIMPGQGWCYQGGSSYYRLGAVYREHWSSPYLSVRVYASAGNVPETSWVCDEKLTEAKSQSGYLDTAPTPVPQPTSAVSVPRLIVEPVLKADSFSIGSWSPDGEYLVFGLTEYFMDEVEHVTIDLRFLEAQTGKMCQPDRSQWTVQKSDGLSDHSAWLPDGRFLFVTDAGEMVAFQPCADGVEDLASRYPVKFTHVMSSDEQSGHVLLKNDEAYWLLDGISLEARKIADVPTESYRPMYDWAPGGERLAISQMSGPEVEDEAFLYIVDWTSVEVEKRIPLEGASDANLPIVEWLTRDELLLHGNTLTVMDFRSEPPAVTDVLRDIFLLDIAYPDDVWGMDTVLSKDGEAYFIGVQVNHPNNKDAYVYSSETRQVEVFHHDVSTLIFFPDGQWMRLLKWEDPPAFRDEYELVWMHQPNETMRLRVEGHVPRVNPQMIPRYLPTTSQLVFSSSQGISLISIPDGKTTGFWELAGNPDFFSVILAPNSEVMIVAADGDGLYYIPLPGK